jgi:hypothetical protein
VIIVSGEEGRVKWGIRETRGGSEEDLWQWEEEKSWW